jgi:hypothetical protein
MPQLPHTLMVSVLAVCAIEVFTEAMLNKTAANNDNVFIVNKI